MTCPVCGNETQRRWRPFCSRRCADLDLAKWMRGDYALPGPEADEFDLPEERLTDKPEKPH